MCRFGDARLVAQVADRRAEFAKLQFSPSLKTRTTSQLQLVEHVCIAAISLTRLAPNAGCRRRNKPA